MIVCAEMSVDSDRELESGDEKESVVRQFIIFFHCSVQGLLVLLFYCFFFSHQHSDEDFDQEEEGHNNIVRCLPAKSIEALNGTAN